MSTVPSASTISSQQAGTTRGNDLREVDLDQFLKLMITELQNQDPLNPLDNAQILQQITQIREIGATNQLTDTLAAVLLGQNLSTGSSLIGREVVALDESGQTVQGIVDRVSIDTDSATDKRLMRLHVGDASVRIENVRQIVAGEGS
jgi:flagellar basal-body rod modification protein FlgD